MPQFWVITVNQLVHELGCSFDGRRWVPIRMKPPSRTQRTAVDSERQRASRSNGSDEVGGGVRGGTGYMPC